MGEQEPQTSDTGTRRAVLSDGTVREISLYHGSVSVVTLCKCHGWLELREGTKEVHVVEIVPPGQLTRAEERAAMVAWLRLRCNAAHQSLARAKELDDETGKLCGYTRVDELASAIEVFERGEHLEGAAREHAAAQASRFDALVRAFEAYEARDAKLAALEAAAAALRESTDDNRAALRNAHLQAMADYGNAWRAVTTAKVAARKAMSR